MNKLPRKNIRYYSKEKGIHGLTIVGTRNSGWKYDYSVVEDFSPDRDFRKRKIVYQGNLREFRDFVKDRFDGKKRDFPEERRKFFKT